MSARTLRTAVALGGLFTAVMLAACDVDGIPNCETCPSGQYCTVAIDCPPDGFGSCLTSWCSAIPAECAMDQTCDCLLASLAKNTDVAKYGVHDFDCYTGVTQSFMTITEDVSYCPPGKDC